MELSIPMRGMSAITAYDGTQVNAVETPQLVRSEETEEIPDDPTPETPPTQDPDEPGGEENIPDEETPCRPFPLQVRAILPSC